MFFKHIQKPRKSEMEKSIETKLKKTSFFWKPHFSSHKFSGFSCDIFDSSRISKNPAKFDFAKGEFWNGWNYWNGWNGENN